MSGEPVVRTSRDGEVTTITLNRPEVRNAGSPELLGALQDALVAAADDDQSRVTVITGSGGSFCAGADLSVTGFDAETVGDAVAEGLDIWIATAQAVLDHPKPTVAKVNGVTAGAGIGLALSADLTVAGTSAYFKQVFLPQLAVAPDVGSTWYLPRLVGRQRARGLALLGEALPAATAAEWGLIWKAVPDEELDAEVDRIAERLASLAAPAVRAVKGLLDQANHTTFDAQLALEREANRELANMGGFLEGVMAFLEKRKPDFRQF